MGMTRQERIAVRKKQEVMQIKEKAPDVSELSEGVPTLRSTDEGVVEYVRYNNVLYKKVLDRYDASPFSLEWVDMVLENSWVAHPDYNTPAYAKDRDGFVHLRGVIKDGDSGTHNITYLPTGFRPTKSAIIITAISGGAAYAIISANNGSIVLVTGNTTLSSLDGITFYAGN